MDMIQNYWLKAIQLRDKNASPWNVAGTKHRLQDWTDGVATEGGTAAMTPGDVSECRIGSDPPEN